MKWVDYHKQESTLEPAIHLSPEINSNFLTPDVSPICLQQAAEVIESAIQQRLGSRQGGILVNFDLNMYGHIFNDVSPICLQQAAEVIESAIQQRLGSRQGGILVNFDLNMYGHIFNSNKSVLIDGPKDLHKLPVCVNWHYNIKKHGRGVCVSFPMRITPRLYDKNVFDSKNGEVIRFSLPVEKITIICAIELIV